MQDDERRSFSGESCFTEWSKPKLGERRRVKIKQRGLKSPRCCLVRFFLVQQFLRDVAAVRGDLLEDFLVKPGVHFG